MIKVSVIIPVYNSQDFLTECLDSVIGQTLKEIEIICINDGSDDASLSILERYQKADDRIRVYSQKRSNAGAARNLGLSKAEGKYLSFLDSDDFFSSEMLEKAYLQAEKDDDDIVIFAANEYDMYAKTFSRIEGSLRKYNCPDHMPFAPIEMKRYLFNSFQNWAWNKLFKKEFIDKNDLSFQEISRTNDMLFTCSALVLANRISVIDETLANYRTGLYGHLQATNHTDPDSFWTAYTETLFKLKGLLKDSYKNYEKSFLNCVLHGMRYNVSRIEKDPKAGDYIKHLINLKAEGIFHFLEMPESDYYRKDDIGWYKKLLRECAAQNNRSRRKWYLKKAGKTLTSLRNNGLDKTMEKIRGDLKK